MATPRSSLEEKFRNVLEAEEASATTPSLPPISPLNPDETHQVLSFSNGYTTSLPKKTILISGGTAGIGLALVRIFAKNGFNVATFSSTAEKVLRTKKEFQAYPNVWVEQIDVRDAEKLSWFVPAVEKRFNSPIQFLINNAAITGPFLPNEEVLTEESNATLAINLSGSINLTRMVQKRIQKTGIPHSVIVNISSRTASGLASAAIYSASKAAVNAFSASIAAEHKPPHFVFALDPGVVDTDMQTKIREADPKKFPFATKAIQMQQEGKLRHPHAIAEDIYLLIAYPRLFVAENNAVISPTIKARRASVPHY